MSAAAEEERRCALKNCLPDEAGRGCTLKNCFSDEAVRRFAVTSLNSGLDRRQCFSAVVTLDASALRHADPVALLLGSVAAVPALHQQRAVLGTIVSELYCNALDHGVLGLDSRWKRDAKGFERYVAARDEKLARLQYGWVRIGLSCSYRVQGGIATIRIDDSGAGFDCTRLEITAADCARLEVAAADCTRFKVLGADRTRDELAAPTALHGRGLALIRALGVRLYPGEGRRGVCAIHRWTCYDQAPARETSDEVAPG